MPRVRIFVHKCRSYPIWVYRLDSCCLWYSARDFCQLLGFDAVHKEKLLARYVPPNCIIEWSDLLSTADKLNGTNDSERIIDLFPKTEVFVHQHGCVTLAGMVDSPRSRRFDKWCRYLANNDVEPTNGEENSDDDWDEDVDDANEIDELCYDNFDLLELDEEEKKPAVESISEDDKRRQEIFEKIDKIITPSDTEYASTIDAEGSADTSIVDHLIAAYTRHSALRQKYASNIVLRLFKRHRERCIENRERFIKSITRLLDEIESLALHVYEPSARRKESAQRKIIEKKLENDARIFDEDCATMELRVNKTLRYNLKELDAEFAEQLSFLNASRTKEPIVVRKHIVSVLNEMERAIESLIMGMRDFLLSRTDSYELQYRHALNTVSTEFRQRQHDHAISIWEWKKRFQTPGLYESLKTLILRYSTEPNWCRREMEDIHRALVIDFIDYKSRSYDSLDHLSSAILRHHRPIDEDQIMNRLLRIKRHIAPLLIVKVDY